MVGVKLSQDCYFFLNSTCSKAENCYFRHEPQAKLTDTVCYYWQTAECTRYKCPYRHSEVKGGFSSRSTSASRTSEQRSVPAVDQKVNKPCFWDSQSSGCIKSNCQYIHVNKASHSAFNEDTSAAALTTSTGQQLSSGSIILNQQKLQALKGIIPFSADNIAHQEDTSKPRRVVVPPGTGILARREITGGIKSRLGVSSQVKSRLGSKGEDTTIISDDSRELSPDLEIIEELRTSALKTIDLRNRIENKIARKSESPEIIRYESDSDQRRGKSKKSKKEKKDEKDKKKRKKFKERTESSVFGRIGDKEDLPSASDYSDLDTPAGSPDPTAITVMSKTAGMYADTGAVPQSAKVRLGKRKNAELDLSVRPRRGSLDVSIDRNPSPPLISDGDMPAIKIKKTVINTPSRSPSPLHDKEGGSPLRVKKSFKVKSFRSRSTSPVKSRPASPIISNKRRSISPSPIRKITKVSCSPERSLIGEDILKAVKQSILDESERSLVKKKKIKAGKVKKSKKSKKNEIKETKKKKKKSSKRKRSSSASSSSPSPLPESPTHSKQKIRKREKKGLKGSDRATKKILDAMQDLDKILDPSHPADTPTRKTKRETGVLSSKENVDRERPNNMPIAVSSSVDDASMLSDAELMKQVDEFIKN